MILRKLLKAIICLCIFLSDSVQIFKRVLSAVMIEITDFTFTNCQPGHPSGKTIVTNTADLHQKYIRNWNVALVGYHQKRVAKTLCACAMCLPIFISCNNEKIEDPPNSVINCGDPATLVVYKIIFLGDVDTLFFNAATSDPNIIRMADEELSKPLEKRLKHINGLLASGTCSYNNRYDWYFIPNEWELVEASIEWCDVFPANPDITGLERACPWPSRVYERL